MSLCQLSQCCFDFYVQLGKRWLGCLKPCNKKLHKILITLFFFVFFFGFIFLVTEWYYCEGKAVNEENQTSGLMVLDLWLFKLVLCPSLQGRGTISPSFCPQAQLYPTATAGQLCGFLGRWRSYPASVRTRSTEGDQEKL